MYRIIPELVFCTPYSIRNSDYIVYISWAGPSSSPFITAVTVWPISPVPDQCGAVCGMRIGKGIRGTRRKPAPVPLCPLQSPFVIVTYTGYGSVTNNTTRFRIGYRIYSLWRLKLQQVTIIVNTRALVASQIPLAELHCADVSFRRLTAITN
jgi:hypothetical protein